MFALHTHKEIARLGNFFLPFFVSFSVSDFPRCTHRPHRLGECTMAHSFFHNQHRIHRYITCTSIIHVTQETQRDNIRIYYDKLNIFPSEFFAILRTSLALMFIYCRYKSIVVKPITLSKTAGLFYPFYFVTHSPHRNTF
jgi:hypothetical protein